MYHEFEFVLCVLCEFYKMLVGTSVANQTGPWRQRFQIQFNSSRKKFSLRTLKKCPPPPQTSAPTIWWKLYFQTISFCPAQVVFPLLQRTVFSEGKPSRSIILTVGYKYPLCSLLCEISPTWKSSLQTLMMELDKLLMRFPLKFHFCSWIPAEIWMFFRYCWQQELLTGETVVRNQSNY